MKAEPAFAAPATPRADGLYDVVREAIEEFRPSLRVDGGDCELLSVEGNVVSVKMSGACVFCQYAGATISSLQERLMLRLGRPMRVNAVRGGL